MILSCVILTKNNENEIEECIKSIESICDEILVIDDFSNDKTIKRASSFKKVKIFQRPLSNNFSSQRNFGLKKASSRWVLFLDSDERVDEKLNSEILQVVNNPFLSESGFMIKRRDVFLGKTLRHGEAGGIALLRLGKRGSGVWMRAVHEKWEIRGRVGRLTGFIIHKSHGSLFDFISKINFYSKIHARENYLLGKPLPLMRAFIWPFMKFVYNYFFKLGFLDGLYGFVFSVLMSFHSFLAWGEYYLIKINSKR